VGAPLPNQKMRPQKHAAESAVLKQILKASCVERWPNVYVIGTNARRVNFSSQQTRALNLIWALWEAKHLKMDMNVCVIGGGLAGISAAAALVSLGLKPTLYEKHPEILFEQRLARHRFIHPSINFWPEQDDINPTTNLPFFDWFAGRCADVLDDIYHEWSNNFSSKICLNENTIVKSIISNGHDVCLRVEKGGILIDEPPFDIAIVAVGFGGEASVAGAAATSYWSADNLEIAHVSATSQHIVCGTGDGGLIDLFRLSFNVAFSQGKKIIDFSNFIYRTKLDTLIRDAEAAVESENDDEASIRLASAYNTAVGLLDDEAKNFLKNSLQRRMSKRITLVGPLPSPFSRRAAPVHKLLLAFLVGENFFNYVQGKVADASSGLASIKGSGRTIRFDHLVPRIGSVDALSALSSGVDIEPFLSAQRAISDITNKVYWIPPLNYLKDGGTTNNRSDARFVQDRIVRARRIVDLYPMVDHLSRLPKINRENHIAAEIRPNTSITHSNFPSKLFGIPLEIRPALIMEFV
jgi:hypothetical protein